MATPLPPERLYARCEFTGLDFTTTDDLADLPGMIGQARAAEAVEFGLAIPREGYNLYVMGPPGTGKRSLAMDRVARRAADAPVPPDWVYVHDFAQPHRPRALRLPPGRGGALREDMKRLLDDLLSAIPSIFESDEYRSRLEELEHEFEEKEAGAFRNLGDEAQQQGIALLRTPSGFGLAPVKDGEVLEPDAFEKLPDKDKKRLAKSIEVLHEKLHKLIRQVPQLMREKHRRVRELNEEFSGLAVSHQMEELRDKYRELPAVLEYLAAVEADLIENAEEFRKPPNGGIAQALGAAMGMAPAFRRYRVNLLVDHGESKGAPVICPDPPSYPNLVGRVEHMEHLGALVTDLGLIKPGALHQASGGYLVLDAQKLLTQPYAWEGLKRALRTRQVRIDSLGQMLSLVSTVSLEPEPIPLEAKVVLLGDRLLYYLLHAYDPEFRELFKVVADFEDDLPRADEGSELYARLIATLARRERLRPFDRPACARLVEQAARDAGDAERLSTRVQGLLDLMREADFLAGDGAGPVSAEHVRAALEAQRRRTGRLAGQVREATLRGTVRIETEGARVGQVNGLAVVELGDSQFGHPTRITATVRMGEGEVIDIQREVELGGAIHSKGVMILSAFLATRYASQMPLALHASLTFEQTYGEVEGDSASMAELCALLAALADLPVKQSIAVTGSVDQFGHMQAIGAVNEKIEGFFDLCQARGLSGGQGVVIPEANARHLMLRADVVQACAEGRFHVWTAPTVDEVISLLTDLPAGEPDDKGVVPEGSVNYLVGGRLVQFASLRQAFSAPPAERQGKPRKRK